jgi:hypothetical protein
VHRAADAVAAEVGVDPVPGGAADRSDRRGDVADPRAGDRGGDSGPQRGLRGADQADIRPRTAASAVATTCPAARMASISPLVLSSTTPR